jgi:hypothetical protein
MKLGRNELCPCGSGIKFKKCCNAFNIDNTNYPTQIFGYDRSLSQDPLCMVSNITQLNQTDLETSFNTKFPTGSWFITFGAHNDITLYGPYDSMDFCMHLGIEKYPSITYSFPNTEI